MRELDLAQKPRKIKRRESRGQAGQGQEVGLAGDKKVKTHGMPLGRHFALQTAELRGPGRPSPHTRRAGTGSDELDRGGEAVSMFPP